MCRASACVLRECSDTYRSAPTLTMVRPAACGQRRARAPPRPPLQAVSLRLTARSLPPRRRRRRRRKPSVAVLARRRLLPVADVRGRAQDPHRGARLRRQDVAAGAGQARVHLPLRGQRARGAAAHDRHEPGARGDAAGGCYILGRGRLGTCAAAVSSWPSVCAAPRLHARAPANPHQPPPPPLSLCERRRCMPSGTATTRTPTA